MSEGNRVGIWGFGREGAAALRFVRGREPDSHVVVVDDDPARVHETAPDVEVAPFEALLHCATVFVSPGIRPNDPRRAELEAAGVAVTTGTNEFLYRAASRTIGVTGTKGKSTTSSFVHALLEASGQKAVLAGNIGEPLLNLVAPDTGLLLDDESWFVAELSSYQCSSLVVSPRIAVVTQLYDDHLAEHGDRNAYWAAKSRIFACGAETLVALPETVEKLRTVANDAVDSVPELVTPPELPPLSVTPPRHVVDNLRVAVAGAAALQGAPITPEVVDAVARAYTPLPHRQVVIADQLGVTWVDDALATTQESVLAALDAFPRARVALLLGGKDRGQPVDRLGVVLRQRHVEVLLVGETSARFGWQLSPWNVDTVPVGTVEAAVAWVAEHRLDIDVCLLSPGAASYDQFRDHAAKGAAFAAAVAALSPVVG